MANPEISLFKQIYGKVNVESCYIPEKGEYFFILSRHDKNQNYRIIFSSEPYHYKDRITAEKEGRTILSILRKTITA